MKVLITEDAGIKRRVMSSGRTRHRFHRSSENCSAPAHILHSCNTYINFSHRCNLSVAVLAQCVEVDNKLQMCSAYGPPQLACFSGTNCLVRWGLVGPAKVCNVSWYWYCIVKSTSFSRRGWILRRKRTRASCLATFVSSCEWSACNKLISSRANLKPGRIRFLSSSEFQLVHLHMFFEPVGRFWGIISNL